MATTSKKQNGKLPLPEGWGDAEEVGDPYGETHDLTEEGPLAGTFLGSRTLITQSPQGDDRESLIYDFEVEDQISGGVMVKSVWGSFDLDRKLADVDKGTEVYVEYLKTIPIQGGKQSLKIFRVLRRTK